MRVQKPANNEITLTPRETRVAPSPCGSYEEVTDVYTVELLDRRFRPPSGGRPGWYACILEARPAEGAPSWAERVYLGPRDTEREALDLALGVLRNAVAGTGDEILDVAVVADAPPAPPVPAQPPWCPPPSGRSSIRSRLLGGAA